MSRTKPNTKEPCYDCGSIIPGHHTTQCDPHFSEGTIRDLPTKPGSQAWLHSVPLVERMRAQGIANSTGKPCRVYYDVEARDFKLVPVESGEEYYIAYPKSGGE